jgi:hypothetical protein
MKLLLVILEYSSCFLLIQTLITALGTFADMPRGGLGSVWI